MRTKRWKATGWLAAGVALLLAGASCSGSSDDDDDAAAATSIKIALASFGNEQLDPTMEAGASIQNVLMPLYDTLLEIGPDGELAPGLAEEWSLADDGITWTFKLRHGVQFHQGWGELTAEDIKFSIERWESEEAVASESPTLRAKVDHVTVVDPYTLEIVTKGLQVDLPYIFSPHQNGAGMIFSKKYLTEKAGDNFAEQTRVLNELPIGSGPFEFVSRQRGVSLTFKAVANHWRTNPSIKEVQFLMVPEASTRVAMLKNGEADIIEASGDQIADIKASGLEARSVPSGLDISLQFTGTYRPPAEGKPTTDPRVRKALSLAIDRKTILETVMGGEGSLQETPFDTLSTTLDIDAAHYRTWIDELNTYDPEAAKRLLAEAGYPNGFSGIKMYSYTRPGAPFLPQIAEIVVSEWKEIGVEVEIVATDYGSYRAHRDHADINDPEIAGDATIHNIAPRFEPSGALYTYFNYRSGSVQLLKIDELDDLIEQISATADDDARQKLVEEAFDQVNDTWVVAPLFYVNVLYGVNPATVGPWHTFQGWPFFGRMLETIDQTAL